MKINTSKMEIVAAQQGMKLCHLASKANIAPQTLSTIKGRGTCAAATACKLADALNMPLEALVGEAHP